MEGFETQCYPRSQQKVCAMFRLNPPNNDDRPIDLLGPIERLP